MRGRSLFLAAGFLVACSGKDAKQPDVAMTPTVAPASAVDSTPTMAEAAPAPKPKPAPRSGSRESDTSENGSVNTIEPLKWVDYDITVPAGSCSVSGRIEEDWRGPTRDFDAVPAE